MDLFLHFDNIVFNSPFYQTIGKRIEKETESQKLQDELKPIIND